MGEFEFGGKYVLDFLLITQYFFNQIKQKDQQMNIASYTDPNSPKKCLIWIPQVIFAKKILHFQILKIAGYGRTKGRTIGPTDGGTDPHIEIRGRI